MAEVVRTDLADADEAQVLARLEAYYPAKVGTMSVMVDRELAQVPTQLRLIGLTDSEAEAALSGWRPSVAQPTLMPSAGRVSRWNTVIKPTDQVVNNSTALVDDTDLQLVTQDAQRYYIQLRVFFSSNSVPDFKYRLVHSGTTLGIRRLSLRGGPAFAPAYAVPNNAFDTADVLLLGSGGPNVVFEDIILPTVLGGIVKFQWAQNTADPSNTVVSQGSYLQYMIV
jgi:hypothetical protein